MTDDEYIAFESQMNDTFNKLVKENADLFNFMWRYGDGKGGHVFNKIKEVIDIKETEPEGKNQYRKKKISHALQKSVFERDEYRCKSCGNHKDLCVDHIHPEALGGNLELNNLQTLCRSCNSKKGKKQV